MKIAFHCWEFPPTIVGGLGTYAQCVTQALAERGNDLEVWAPDQPDWPKSVPEVQHSRIAVRRIPLFDATPALPHVLSDELQGWGRFFSDIMTFNLLAAAETRRRQIDQAVDVVAIQDWLSGMAGLVLTGPPERRSPVVFHVHSAEWGRQPCGPSGPVLHFEGSLAYHADAIVTVSDAMRDDLIAHGWDGFKIHAVHNGVDPERYRPDAAPHEEALVVRDRYGVPAEAPLLLFVGRLTAVKGVLQLVEAMRQILEQRPEVHLVVLGVGELQEPVRARVAELGLGQRVHLRYEFISEAERIAHYQACDVAVFPSTYEPFGIVCLEALAMGKPVVAGANGVVGFREQVVPAGAEQCGLHVNGNDPADIAWGLREALAQPGKWKEWGENGRRRVLEGFSWGHAAAKTEDVYRQAIERFAASGR
jgi:glycosyltransferase involved in cell wall biosynthesis